MAGIETLKIPTEVKFSKRNNWEDDIVDTSDVDYATYENEKSYISPKTVDKEKIADLKRIRQKLGLTAMLNSEKI